MFGCEIMVRPFGPRATGGVWSLDCWTWGFSFFIIILSSNGPTARRDLSVPDALSRTDYALVNTSGVFLDSSGKAVEVTCNNVQPNATKRWTS